jgi:DNA-binding HxlR family transcriptional regulator
MKQQFRSLTNPLSLRMVACLRQGASTSRALERDVAPPSAFAFNGILKKLTRDGILLRVTSNNRVEYSLTALGVTLAMPACVMLDWLEQHADDIQQHRDSYFTDVEEEVAA